ncbi:transporter [Propionivibrio dicarboxylicus]|uniref:MetA-pathway of phenol degradation n=1 Tax=Propionivibrio dicarboxylicus TaxID=83767 RepID=A0A1G8ALW0_9RHOO|nr:transporter [Propionivibrio dicarboxylicus]SDH22015.1 hypothetical protein SAMN05660652_01432 [Propionivibrio dicarboxylicus]
MFVYFVGIVSCLLSTLALASDARSYVQMPVSTSLAEFRVAQSQTIAPGQPRDVKTDNQTDSIKLTHYFDLLGTLGALQVTTPYTRLNRHSVTDTTASGMSDSSIVLGVGLYNMPALSREAFQKFDKNGFSAAGAVTFYGNTGTYDKTKALNTGSNRSAQKVEIQTAWRSDALLLEAIAGGTQYGRNAEYLTNNTLEQKTLYHAETHFSYNVSSKLWASLDTFFVNGGEAVLNNRSMNNSQRSFSSGFVTGYMLANNQLVKLIYQNNVNSSKVSTRLQGLALSYTYAF